MKTILKKTFAVIIAITMIMTTFGSVNIFANNEIIGDSSIYLPPSGKTMQVDYSVSGTSEDIVWSVENAPSGVKIMEDGALIVTGDAIPSSVFTIKAESLSGELLAEKEVTILLKTETYSDLFDRYYEDFEVYSNDENIVMKASPQRSAIKYAAQIGTTLAVGKEPGGNTYAKASGSYYWGTLATFEVYPSYNSNQLYLNGSKVVTFEGRFMIENATSAEQALMFFDNAGLKLMYKASSDDSKADIYDFATSSTTSIATVNKNEWFDLRAEFDHINSTYDVYLNNALIIDDNTLNNNLYIGAGSRGNGFYIGASVDDLAMYNGRLVIPTFPEIPEVVYLTDGQNEAVIELSNSLYLGKYEIKDAVSYAGAMLTDGKLALQKDSTASFMASSSEYNAQKSFNITTMQGLEYDFSDSLNVPAGTGTVADGKLDLTSGHAEFDLSDVKGKVLVAFDLYNESATSVLDVVSDSVTKSIAFPEAGAEGKKVTAIIDTIKDSYIVILGDEIVQEGTIECESVDYVRLSNGKIDNFVFTSMTKTKPFVFTPSIDGVVAVGQTVCADYRYFSPWNKDKSTETIEWKIADTEMGSYTKVGEGLSFTPNDEQVNKWLKFEVKASDSVFESNVIGSDASKIADVYSVTFSGDKIRAEIMNSLNVPHVFALTRFYSGNQLVKTKMDKVVFGGGNSEVLENTKDGADGASVILLYPDTLKPVSSQKAVGTVPEETAISDEEVSSSALSADVKNGKLYIESPSDDLASVVIYGHGSADIFKEYSAVYKKEDVFAKVEDSVSIMYATNTSLKANKKTEITLPQLVRGAYSAEIQTRSGASVKCLWMEKAEDVLKNSEMSKDGFLDVIKLFSDKTDAENQYIFGEYKKLDQTKKEVIDSLLLKEDYNIKKLDTLVLFMTYLTKPELSGDVWTKMSLEFTANNYDEEKVKVIAGDATLAETVSAIFTAGWTNIETFIDVVYEKSILYGVYHVKNYQEADSFLKALNYSAYTQSAYKDNICNLVAGKLYNSITELKTEIANYTPVSMPGGSLGGGGSIGGGSSSGGGGGSSSVTQIAAPSIEPSVKNVYSDVDDKHWAKDAIVYLSGRNIINGMPDGRFVPDGNITRAEFVKIICEAFKLASDEKQSFGDVNSGDWFNNYVAIAGGLNIIYGSDGMFFPERTISREDAAVIIYRVIENKELKLSEKEKTFADEKNISDYAKAGVGKLYATGLINGMEDGSFCPKNNMTRAECAKMVSDILRRYGI